MVSEQHKHLFDTNSNVTTDSQSAVNREIFSNVPRGGGPTGARQEIGAQSSPMLGGKKREDTVPTEQLSDFHIYSSLDTSGTEGRKARQTTLRRNEAAPPDDSDYRPKADADDKDKPLQRTDPGEEELDMEDDG